MRARLLNSGVADPLRQIPSLHALLDATEQAVLESFQKEDERKRFIDDLYAPQAADAVALNGSGYKPAPSGFDDEAAMEQSFDAFMAAAR